MSDELGLHAEVTLPDGTTFYIGHPDEPGERLIGVVVRSKRGDGNADCSFVLRRRIDQDYPDIGLLDDWKLIRADGTTVYEGRLAGNPRALDSDGHHIFIQLQGWMTHSKDRKCSRVYVDRSMAGWREPPLSRRAYLAATLGYPQGKAPVSTQALDGLVWDLPNEAFPVNETTEVHYDIGPGLKVGVFGYNGARTGAFTNFEGPYLFASDTEDFSGAGESYALTLDGTSRTVDLSPARRFLMMRTLATGAQTPAPGWQQRFSQLGVYEDHGLTLHAIDGQLPGVIASDVLRDLIGSFCPRLNSNGVEDTDYPIGHLVFRNTYPFDAFLDTNKFHIWDLGVFEGRSVFFRPTDLSDFDWQVRMDDPGTEIAPQGESVDQLANGIEVTFTDVRTGRVETLTPEDSSDLADPNPNNPANRWGYAKWTDTTLSSPCLPADAIQRGRVKLIEFNQPKSAAAITVSGFIQDREGHWRPGSEVRSGQKVAVVDHPNDAPRLIVEGEWNQDARKLVLGADSTLPRIEALADRTDNALQAAGLI